MNEIRKTPIEIDSEEFKQVGYQLIDRIAEFLENIRQKPVTTGELPEQIERILGERSLPENGTPLPALLSKTADLLFNHSLFNGHPKFLGYITSSPAPAAFLADLLASAVNANVGANILSPMATAIEKQTIQWLAEFIGVPPNYGGILVSGGNMANLTGFLAARTMQADYNIKEQGLDNTHKKLIIYCAKSTHTWIEKAAALFGHGTSAIRWINVDQYNRLDISALEVAITEDLRADHSPFIVVGNAGDVSTGVVDDLKGIATICKKFELWFHIDGAYGIPAAAIPELKELFEGITEADSIALDPHKWLYSPLEAGCILVKNRSHLTDTFSSHPEYYNFSMEDEVAVNYYEYGLQNSRGFRALKVWLTLQQVGKSEYVKMIADDIALSKLLFDLANQHPQLETITNNLSISTFRFLPGENKASDAYLNKLNETLLNELQKGGEVFLSNAVIGNKYCLRACIVNFRTTQSDIYEIIDIIVREGNKIHAKINT